MADRRVRVVRVGRGEDPARWALFFETHGAGSGMTLVKGEKTTYIYRGEIDGRRVYLKVRQLIAWRERVKHVLGVSRHWRQWRGAEWLTARGIATAPALVLARVGAGDETRELLVLGALPGMTVLGHLACAGLSVRGEHAIAREVGRGVARLVAAGRYNRDHKPSNIVVTRVSAGKAEAALIDTVAIRPVFSRRGAEARMLASLAIEAMGCGVLPRRGVMMRVVREAGGERRRAREMWGRVVEAVKRHGDARPAVMPVGDSPQRRRGR